MSSEDKLQVACVGFLETFHPELLFFHVPNGGYRNAREGAKFKRMGVRPGVSDIIILSETRNGYPGACIELKTCSGKLQKSQKEFLEKAEKNWYSTAVIRSIDEFIEHITSLYGKGRLV